MLYCFLKYLRGCQFFKEIVIFQKSYPFFVLFQTARTLLILTLPGGGAAAVRRTVLHLRAQLDLASSYAVPGTGRTESPTSLNYAKLCVELKHTCAVICEMWGDLVIRHIVFE